MSCPPLLLRYSLLHHCGRRTPTPAADAPSSPPALPAWSTELDFWSTTLEVSSATPLVLSPRLHTWSGASQNLP